MSGGKEATGRKDNEIKTKRKVSLFSRAKGKNWSGSLKVAARDARCLQSLDSGCWQGLAGGGWIVVGGEGFQAVATSNPTTFKP
ncbi:hypothetical protein AMTR_s00168p00068360 [Amborella trichopoda]|uniref:Uncharacterized protein n=1 Tax=Amborella trichopoda TaxID=13333 RepID=W1PR64_AMBTC|nr:hypothetical protein AMTR_s00168p00068360 [Amborella trichopoda]